MFQTSPTGCHEMNVLEIIDSAIKIGLGGIIGWASSYTVSKLKYDREREKYLLDKKLSIYESSIDELENYFDRLSRVFSHVGGIQKSSQSQEGKIVLSEGDLDILKDRNSALVESWSSRRKAITRLKLLGANEIDDLLLEIKNLEKEFRAIVIFGSGSPSVKDVDKLREDKEILIEEVRNKMAKFYNELMK